MVRKGDSALSTEGKLLRYMTLLRAVYGVGQPKETVRAAVTRLEYGSPSTGHYIIRSAMREYILLRRREELGEGLAPWEREYVDAMPDELRARIKERYEWYEGD
jgi:hypothetical protein